MAVHSMTGTKTLRTKTEGGRLDAGSLRRRLASFEAVPDEEGNQPTADYGKGVNWALVLCILRADRAGREHELRGITLANPSTGEKIHVTRGALSETIEEIEVDIAELKEVGNAPKSEIDALYREKDATWSKLNAVKANVDQFKAGKLRDQLVDDGFLDEGASTRDRIRTVKRLTKEVKGICRSLLIEAGAATKNLTRGGTGIDFQSITLGHYDNAIAQAKAQATQSKHKEEQHETCAWVVEDNHGNLKAEAPRDTHEEAGAYSEEAPGANIDAAAEATDLDLERAARAYKAS
jgi:hypothetical protein